MKWRCAAYLACAGFAMAQGDDDLGLPQLDAPVPDPTPPSGYFMHDGTVYALIGEKAVPLEKEVMMRVTPGKIIGFDGRQVRVPAGMMYMANGSFAPLSVAQAAAQAAATPVVPTSLNATSAGAQTPVTGAVAVNQTSQPVLQPVVPTVGVTAGGLSQPVTNLLYPAEVNPPAGPATQVTAQPHTSPATIPPPQPAFAAPFRPDRTGPRMDVERPVDRTRPESVPNTRTDVTRVGRDDQRPMDRTRPGTDDHKYRDRTMPGSDDIKPRDRTVLGPDDERPPDPTRRSR
jgi:hypothetical protein